jgi:formylglycine-generating enzyme required for sulfatase activity
LDTNNPPTKQVATGQNPKTFSASGLINNTPYFWKITAKDSKGATTTGPVWKFTTIAAGNNPPTAPSSPNPADLATGVSTSPTLSWSCSDPDGDAITYDVYLDMNNPPTKQVATGQGPKTFAATGLTNNTPYFWKIVAKDSKGATTTGPVWKFTTESGQIVQDMIVVNGGTFTAGTTPVTISRFTIDKYEVTFEVWTDIRNWALTHGYTDLPTGSNGNQPIGTNNPVTNVNWFDVIKWCNARSEKNGLTPIYYTDTTQSTIYRTGSLEIDWDTNEMVKWGANGFRLPTETEWEFAARGGTQSHGYTYSGSDTVGKVAWYYDNSYPSTHSVGQLQPNELGIYDMSGNATEWCWDYFDVPYPSGGTIDPRGPMWSSSSRRVQRGGNALSWEGYCLVDREHVELNFPENFDTSVGFRCVKN